MRISQKAEYAVRAVLDLALHAPPNGGVRSSEIARRTGVPEKFLEAILLELRKGGFVASKRGPDGGHWLARDPARVTVGAILEAIDGSLATARKKARRRGTPADLCLEAFWGRIEAAFYAVVNTVTVDDLRRQAETRGGMDFII
jgi:Rrf2 family protein